MRSFAAETGEVRSQYVDIGKKFDVFMRQKTHGLYVAAQMPDWRVKDFARISHKRGSLFLPFKHFRLQRDRIHFVNEA